MSSELDEINAHLEFLNAESYDSLENIVDDLEECKQTSSGKFMYYTIGALGTLLTTFNADRIVDQFYSYRRLSEELGMQEPLVNLAFLGTGASIATGLMYTGNKNYERKAAIGNFIEAYEEDELEEYLSTQKSLKIAKYLEETQKEDINEGSPITT